MSGLMSGVEGVVVLVVLAVPRGRACRPGARGVVEAGRWESLVQMSVWLVQGHGAMVELASVMSSSITR
jgi:hypothetical protein